MTILTLRPLDWPTTAVQLELESPWEVRPAELEAELRPAIAQAFLGWPECATAPFKPGTDSAARMPGRGET